MSFLEESRGLGVFGRARRFIHKPGNEQMRSILVRWAQVFPGVPLPMRLPTGLWWLAEKDFLGIAILSEGFEPIERAFVERFLRPGMTVLDVGAHHGFYTLLASRAVGRAGRVLAFEPSPRERKRLNTHMRINRVRNVEVESRAVGEELGTAELYLVCGTETGCNSLRKPNVEQDTVKVTVPVERLDRVLEEHGIAQVDFVKLDVEGAELSVLKGAPELLSRRPRPVFLAEVQDIRTQPWGYRALDIVRHLETLGFRWFRTVPGGGLEPMDLEHADYDGNFVAVPNEKVVSIERLMSDSWQSSPDTRVPVI